VRFKIFAGFVLALFAIALSPNMILAQEGEITVIDEVIAQVNDDVITLSMLRKETKERIETLKQQAGKSEKEATEEVSKRQAELIATLINEKLLLQRGKEMDMANEIEAEVNRRMLGIAQEQGINSIEKLYEAMRASGINPDDIRATMRTEMMKQAVLQQEVDRRVYLEPSLKEVQEYFKNNKQKFLKQESVKLSEIYLSSAKKDDAAVKARAAELVTQIRAGADFKALAAANSEREKDGQRTAPKDFGEVGEFDIPNLREDLVTSLKNVQAGGVTDPIKTNEGYQILRVDARTPAGTDAVFVENRVREAILMERQPKEREAFLEKLRNEAFIKITEQYRASVEPLLKLKAPVAAKSNDKDDKKKKP
jgi:peptidyl-prolyl cis-trans isomerase SurA